MTFDELLEKKADYYFAKADLSKIGTVTDTDEGWEWDSYEFPQEDVIDDGTFETEDAEFSEEVGNANILCKHVFFKNTRKLRNEFEPENEEELEEDKKADVMLSFCVGFDGTKVVEVSIGGADVSLK